MNRKELTIEQRQLIIDLHTKQEKSYSEIAKIVSRSRSTIQKVIQRYKNENRVENAARSGRPPKLSNKDKRRIVRMVKQNPFKSARKIADDLNNLKTIQVHSETVRRAIVETGLSSRTPRKKPFISATNKKKRIGFAKEYIHWSTESWSKVLFSDESKFCIFGSNGRLRVWRKTGDAFNPKHTIKTVKHGGGGLMVWGCMSAAGVGNLVFIENIMDQHVYLDILKNNLKENATKLGMPADFLFQQDNDPKHTAHRVRLWLLYNTKTLPTRPQSLDLNPIEHLWDKLDQKLRTHKISNKIQLKEILQKEWHNISTDYTKRLVHSMPQRLQSVLKMKGFPTKY